MKIKRQIGRFILISGFTTIIDFMILMMATELLGVNYLLSNIFSFAISATTNFILSTKFVFEVNNNATHTANFITFIVLSFIGLLFNQFILWILTAKFGIFYIISKAAATGIVMFWNFISKKLFFEKMKI